MAAFIASSLFGQAPKAIWLHELSTRQGLSENTNNYVYHDSEGFVWISSIAGLNRFDGQRIKQYRFDPNDTTSLFGKNIQSNFYEDDQKNLWFCTYESILCYERKTDSFRHYFIKDGSGKDIKEDYYVFFLERDSFLWLRAKDTIYRLNTHRAGSQVKIAQTTAFHCRAFADKKGSVNYLYLLGQSSFRGVEVLKLKNGQVTDRQTLFGLPKGALPSLDVRDVLHEPDSITWLATTIGLFAWNRKSGHLRPEPRFFGKLVYFANWKERHLLLNVDGEGLYLYEKNEGTATPLTIRKISGDSIDERNLTWLHVDQEDNLWMTVISDGLLYANLLKGKFDFLPLPKAIQGKKNPFYQSLLESPNGSFWYSTYMEGLFLLDEKGKVLQHFTHQKSNPFSLPSNSIYHMAFDGKGRLWVATTNGIAWYEASSRRFHTVADENGVGSRTYTYLLLMKDGTLLASSIEDGVYAIRQFTDKIWLEPALEWGEKGNFTTIYEGQNGQVFICRNEAEVSVFKWVGNKLQQQGALPIQGAVNGFYEDGKNLWMATTYGLAKMDKSKPGDPLKVLTEKDGLPDNFIRSIVSDNSGNIWCSMTNSLAMLPAGDTVFRSFGIADGIYSDEFYVPAAFKLSNGKIWFGGSKGITIVQPSDLRKAMTPSNIRITGININDEQKLDLKCHKTEATNFSLMQEIKLSYQERTISFDFTATDYSDPASTKLFYRLKGVDPDWVALPKGEYGFARYANLPSGNHTFMIRATNSEGIFNETPHEFNFYIEPPFWCQWWFILLSLSIGAIIALVWLKERERRIKEKAELKTRIAENKMAALRAQMNPHFIFNSLQSASGYVARKDFRGAIEYIHQFSKLMRMILDFSREGLITLEKEIELLDLYMKVESKRFSQPFTYAFSVDKELDTFEVKIPSMLLQPFVENSIKHGLFHKKSQGHITISFLKDKGMLKCVVEDNGIGRDEAKKINEQQGRGHVSKGLEIVKERLDIIGATHSGNYEVTVTDLFDLEHNPTGTRVDVTLPITS